MASDSKSDIFVMYGARSAMADGLAHIEAQVDALENAVVQKPGLAFDLAKTLIESVCRTVLNERAVEFAAGDDLPKLFKLVTRTLPFLPPEVSTEVGVRRSLERTLSGLQTAVQGVCELRNSCGFASHGGDGSRPKLESVQAILAAESADAIVGFLYRVHRQGGVSGAAPLNYQTNADFNAYVNDANDAIRIFSEEFEPSKVLFEMAPEPYRLYLSAFRTESEMESMSDSQGTEQ